MDRKREKEIRLFFEQEKKPDIDKKRKQQTLEFLRMERKHLHVKVKKPYGKRIMEQMEYLSPRVWLFQGGLVLVLGYLLRIAERESVFACMMLCAPMIGIVGFTEILRSYRQSMWELEQACRYNLRQLMGMRLLIFAVMDSVVAGIVMLLGMQAGMRFGEMLLFFLIPQIIVDSVYLHLMARFRWCFQGTVLVGAAVVMGVVYMSLFELIIETPGWLRILSQPPALLLLVLVSGGVLALGCMRFLNKPEAEYCGT